MLKKVLFAFALALAGGLLTPAAAQQRPSVPITYVSISTFTPPGNGNYAWAFQNTSASLNVKVVKLDVIGISTASQGGLGTSQYWLYASTRITAGGTGTVSFYDYAAANTTAPTYISVSTSPQSVQLEGLQSGQLPLVPPFVVDDSSGSLTGAGTSSLQRTGYNPWGWQEANEFTLPAGSSRGLVLKQQPFVGSNISTGLIMVRVVYIVKSQGNP